MAFVLRRPKLWVFDAKPKGVASGVLDFQLYFNDFDDPILYNGQRAHPPGGTWHFSLGKCYPDQFEWQDAGFIPAVRHTRFGMPYIDGWELHLEDVYVELQSFVYDATNERHPGMMIFHKDMFSGNGEFDNRVFHMLVKFDF